MQHRLEASKFDWYLSLAQPFEPKFQYLGANKITTQL